MEAVTSNPAHPKVNGFIAKPDLEILIAVQR